MSDADFSPPSITRALVRRWWLVVFLAVLGAVGGAAFGMLQTPVYQAESYVVVVAEDKNNDIAVNFAQAYGRVITQPEILEQVATTVGTTTAAALRTKVQASTSPDAPLIEITASAWTAGRSAAIANAAVDALVVYGNQHTTETGVRMASFSRAAVPTEASSPQPMLDAAVGAATGVLIGGLAVLGGIGRRSETSASASAATAGTPDDGSGPPVAPGHAARSNGEATAQPPLSGSDHRNPVASANAVAPRFAEPYPEARG